MTAPTGPAGAPRGLSTQVTAGVGSSPRRPDGTPKVKGEFAYSSDMWMEDMIWGVTLRSPHPYARVRSIDIGAALAMRAIRIKAIRVRGGASAGMTGNDCPRRAASYSSRARALASVSSLG